MRPERFFATFSPSFEPATYRPFTHSQGDSNVLLLPALLLEYPGAFAPLFSPIGFFLVLPYLLVYHTLLSLAEISKEKVKAVA